jgi:hypothetical protein
VRKSALIIAALLAAGSIAAATDATANLGLRGATTLQTRTHVTNHRPDSSVPCWKTWQSVRDTLLHHTTPPGCGKKHRHKS